MNTTRDLYSGPSKSLNSSSARFALLSKNVTNSDFALNLNRSAELEQITCDLISQNDFYPYAMLVGVAVCSNAYGIIELFDFLNTPTASPDVIRSGIFVWNWPRIQFP